MAAIHLLPLGDAPPALLRRLAAPLEARFAAPVVLDPPAPLRPEWLDPARGRYDAAAILQALLASPPSDAGWRLAVLDGHVFGPGLEAAVGVATVGGCCGILALGHLYPPPPADPDLLFRRALTEAVHEIGHLAGLEHCPDEQCAMCLSRTLDDIDRKGPNLCERCRR